VVSQDNSSYIFIFNNINKKNIHYDYLFKVDMSQYYTAMRAAMSIPSRLNADIAKLIDDNSVLIVGTNSDTINVREFESREILLKQLSVLKAAILDSATKLETTIAKTKQTHVHDLSTMDKLMNRTTKKETKIQVTDSNRRALSNQSDIYSPAPVQTVVPASMQAVMSSVHQSTHQSVHQSTHQSVHQSTHQSASPNWTLVKKKGSDVRTLNGREVDRSEPKLTDIVKMERVPVRAPKTYAVPAVNGMTYTRIKITNALGVMAIQVSTFDSVKQDGNLYYVEPADHFAIRIYDQLLHGNIGTIYTDAKNPEKIKDCKYASGCMKRDRCDYYHDPSTFANSNDRRNFIASSWLYTPPNSQYKNKSRSRRFGSLEHLDTDIVSLSDDEITRYRDQAMHDLLCVLVIACSRTNM
jgi:hypothetical protein